MQNTPFLLIINDGWGVAPDSRGNAIVRADTPTFDHVIKNYWVTALQAGGESVGLPWGEMGNSEVGHLSLGSGKIIYQDLPRITRAISNGDFFTNEKFLHAFEKVKKSDGVLHIAGLISDGGVHAHIEHFDSLLELATKQKVQKIAIHCFLDGRDVAYNSALGFISDVQERIQQFGSPAVIATIIGRYFAMDRDNRWERIQKSYNAMVYGEADSRFQSAKEAIESYYKNGIYDEQIPPTVIGNGVPITNKDALIFINYRGDRMRQLAKVFVLSE